MVVAVRVRSLVWFVTGALLALAAAWVVMSALSVDAAPGDSDSTFEPIDNCRLFDFRPGQDPDGPRKTPLGPRDTYVQQVTGQVGNCNIPSSAVAVAMNVTIANPTAQSNLRVFPANIDDVPTASNLNWVAGQSPTPNKVDVKLSPDGAIKIFNQNGTVNVLADVVGFYTAESLSELDQRLSALESEVATLRATNGALEAEVAEMRVTNVDLEAKLAPVNVGIVDGQPTFTFDGVNVRIVDGTGDTLCNTAGFEGCNGRGNLIIGYNEDATGAQLRGGSHNLVSGTENSYRGHSGVVFGSNNVVAAQYATVTGGEQNRADANHASVSGGAFNHASGVRASVSGGQSGRAQGVSASVSGGSSNVATGETSSVSGGFSNQANGLSSSVLGGRSNVAGSSPGPFNISITGGELVVCNSTNAQVC